MVRDSERLFTETKATLFDLVSDVRSKLDSDETIRRNYDSFVKEMVLLGSMKQHRDPDISDDDTEGDPVSQLLNLLRTCISLIGENVGFQRQQFSRMGDKVKEMEFEGSSSERELRKRLDIVCRVFKQASGRLTRIDRSWQEVIDSQVYIIEELINDTE